MKVAERLGPIAVCVINSGGITVNDLMPGYTLTDRIDELAKQTSQRTGATEAAIVAINERCCITHLGIYRYVRTAFRTMGKFLRIAPFVDSCTKAHGCACSCLDGDTHAQLLLYQRNNKRNIIRAAAVRSAMSSHRGVR
jgi:NAD(P)-dependent dehydrogenase (short-subunit alcohol dehydrogenase family)